MQKWTILLLCLLGGLCKAQNRLPLLSKSDMYADFDTLYSTLSKVNPHAYVRKTVNHYAMLDSIGALRTQIAHISTPEEFFWLVNKALTFCQDDHSAVLPKRFYPFIDSLDRIRLHFQVSDTSYISAWNQLKRARNKAIQLQLPIRYLNGQYKVLETFTVNGTRILQGAELRTFNDLKIADYLKQHLGDVETLHWDFDRNQWYKDDFYRGNHLAPEAKIRFVFFQEGHRLELRCTLKDSVQIEKPLDAAPKDQDSEPFIRFFEKQGILYIRMPEMSHMEFYLRQLDSIHRQVPVQNISKIIWDIRGNAGGDDRVWINVLFRLLDKPVVRTITLCLNEQNPYTYRFEENNLKPYSTDYVNKGYLQLPAIPDTMGLYADAWHFKGKIFLLQDEHCFSSAGSLISMCPFSDQLINVGNSTGWFAGFGVMPWVYCLPQSKILYWVEPLLDFTRVRQPKDLFHNDLKLPVEKSFQQHVDHFRNKGKLYTEDYLFTKDPVFRKAMARD